MRLQTGAVNSVSRKASAAWLLFFRAPQQGEGLFRGRSPLLTATWHYGPSIHWAPRVVGESGSLLLPWRTQGPVRTRRVPAFHTPPALRGPLLTGDTGSAAVEF